MRPSVRQALRDAYSSADASRARRSLTNLSRRLRDEHPGAAAFLDEGLDETPTVKRLGLPSKLERQLSTTNAIGECDGIRPSAHASREAWRGGRMILRWTVTAVADAADRFRRMRGAREGMTALVRALNDHEIPATAIAPREQVG